MLLTPSICVTTLFISLRRRGDGVKGSTHAIAAATPARRCRADGVQRGAQRRRFKALRRYLLRGGKCEASAIQPSTNSRSWESRSFTPAALHDWQWLPRNTSSHNCKRQAKTRGFRRVRALERTSGPRRLMRTRLSVYAAKETACFLCWPDATALCVFVLSDVLQVHLPATPPSDP